MSIVAHRASPLQVWADSGMRTSELWGIGTTRGYLPVHLRYSRRREAVQNLQALLLAGILHLKNVDVLPKPWRIRGSKPVRFVVQRQAVKLAWQTAKK